ncbi:MAG: hypothetical protein RL198_952, partial [Actinomycetota bacterium]
MVDTEEINIRTALESSNLDEIGAWLAPLAAHEIAEEITRLDSVHAVLVWRLLQRDIALEVFEELDAANQQELLSGLRDGAFRELLENMAPDDRAKLLGEAPASFVRRSLAGLSARERAMTAELLGYPEDSVGRVMTPEVVTIQQSTPASEILDQVRRKADSAETISILAVVDRSRRFVGNLELSRVVLASPTDTALDLADSSAPTVTVTDDAESAARLVQATNHLGLMVVDSESRVIGILTVDDAIDVIEEANTEDVARQAAALPGTGHYLSASVWSLARLRVVWLLILIVASTLTVSVLQFFEGSLERVTALAL